MSCAARGLSYKVALVFWISSALAVAHAEDGARYAVVAESAAEREAWRPQAERWLGEQGEQATPIESAPSEVEASVAPAALEVLDATEHALRDARERVARFDEQGALRVLSEAERALIAHLEVPGAGAFLAELYVQMALTAASLSETGLAETALARAATLDPRRSLEAGEAPPDVLALARRIRDARDRATRSRTRLDVAPEGALLWLDGALLGPAPRDIEVSPGLHLLVARKAGYAPYAALVELGPGARAPIAVLLSPEPREDARQQLARSLVSSAQAEPRARAFAAASGAHVWLFEVTRNQPTRVVRCERDACRTQGELRAPLPAVAMSEGMGEGPSAQRGRGPGDQQQSEHRRARRWPWWVAASASVVAGAAVAVWATRDEHTHTSRELTLNPGQPPAR